MKTVIEKGNKQIEVPIADKKLSPRRHSSPSLIQNNLKSPQTTQSKDKNLTVPNSPLARHSPNEKVQKSGEGNFLETLVEEINNLVFRPLKEKPKQAPIFPWYFRGKQGVSTLATPRYYKISPEEIPHLIPAEKFHKCLLEARKNHHFFAGMKETGLQDGHYYFHEDLSTILAETRGNVYTQENNYCCEKLTIQLDLVEPSQIEIALVRALVSLEWKYRKKNKYEAPSFMATLLQWRSKSDLSIYSLNQGVNNSAFVLLLDSNNQFKKISLSEICLEPELVDCFSHFNLKYGQDSNLFFLNKSETKGGIDSSLNRFGFLKQRNNTVYNKILSQMKLTRLDIKLMPGEQLIVINASGFNSLTESEIEACIGSNELHQVGKLVYKASHDNYEYNQKGKGFLRPGHYYPNNVTALFHAAIPEKNILLNTASCLKDPAYANGIGPSISNFLINKFSDALHSLLHEELAEKKAKHIKNL